MHTYNTGELRWEDQGQPGLQRYGEDTQKHPLVEEMTRCGGDAHAQGRADLVRKEDWGACLRWQLNQNVMDDKKSGMYKTQGGLVASQLSMYKGSQELMHLSCPEEVQQAGGTTLSSAQPHTLAWRLFQHGLYHSSTVFEPYFYLSVFPHKLIPPKLPVFLSPWHAPFQYLPRASGQSVLGSYVTCGKRLRNTVPWRSFSLPCLFFFYSLSLPSFLVLLFFFFLSIPSY